MQALQELTDFEIWREVRSHQQEYRVANHWRLSTLNHQLSTAVGVDGSGLAGLVPGCFPAYPNIACASSQPCRINCAAT